jgi:hypothetical protein
LVNAERLIVLHKNRVPLALAWHGGPEAMRLGSAVQTEGLGFAVVFAEVPVDRGVEVEQRLEDAELQATMGKQGAENLDSGITFPILPRAAPRPWRDNEL